MKADVMTVRYLILVLTTRCNLACGYCYNGEPAKMLDMPEAVMLRALGLAASRGESFHLQLTGGEPTLVPDAIQKAAALARDTGLCGTMGIQTNATRLTPELLETFKTHEIQVGVSLDGPPAIHEQLRGMAAETLRGLQLLETAGIPFRVTTVVTASNVGSLDRLVLTLAGFSRARGIGLDLLVRKGRAGTGGHAVPANPQSLKRGVARMLVALDAVNAWRSSPIRLRERDLLMSGKKTPAFCHACRGQSVAVHPDGRIFPCGQTLGDARVAAGTVWEPEIGRRTALQTIRLQTKACRDCPVLDRCPGECPSRLFYNQDCDPALACELYRAVWDTETRDMEGRAVGFE